MRARVASLRPVAAPTDAQPRSESHRRNPREAAQVAEVTRWLPASFSGWPSGIRVIARRERPHPGAHLRITDVDGWRTTFFATNTRGWRIADLEIRHRLRARTEDRIRNLKDTGLGNLPLQAFAKNVIWLELVQLAAELLAWAQTLAFADHPARRWEPKRLRLRILHTAARLIRSGRRRTLRISRDWPWADLITETTRDPPTRPKARRRPTTRKIEVNAQQRLKCLM